jgi:hypothetical protein
MTIQQLITLASNRLAALNTSRANAVALGDVERIDALDAEIAETQNTLDALNTL